MKYNGKLRLSNTIEHYLRIQLCGVQVHRPLGVPSKTATWVITEAGHDIATNANAK